MMYMKIPQKRSEMLIVRKAMGKYRDINIDDTGITRNTVIIIKTFALHVWAIFSIKSG